MAQVVMGYELPSPNKTKPLLTAGIEPKTFWA